MPEIKLKSVVIEGAELLHPKMISIIEWFMDKEPDHGLERIIVKHKGGPKGMFGKFFPELNTFIFNLEHCLEDALEKAIKEKDDILSLAGLIWLNLIWTPGHEFHHAVAFSTDDGAMLEDEEWLQAEEEEADDYADEAIIELARVRPDLIEPPSIGEMPYFGVEVMARIVNAIQKGEDWANIMKEMSEKGEVYAGKNFSLTSLREYLRLGKGGDDWEEVAIPAEVVKPVEMSVGATVDEEVLPFIKTEDLDTGLPKEGMIQQALPLSNDAGAEVCFDQPEVEYQGDLDAIDGGGRVQEEVPAGCELNTGGAWPIFNPQPPKQTMATGPTPHPDFTPQAPANDLAGLSMDDPTVQTVHAIFKRVIDHLFQNVWDPRGMWKDGKALWIPVDISDIPGSDIVVAFQTDISGQVRNLPAEGELIGRTFKNRSIPGYDILMKIAGVRCARRVMVQNPWTKSKYAPMAQAGEQITWILDMDVQGDEAWRGHYRNGVWNLKQRR